MKTLPICLTILAGFLILAVAGYNTLISAVNQITVHKHIIDKNNIDYTAEWKDP